VDGAERADYVPDGEWITFLAPTQPVTIVARF
jgi:hypothetical protein